MRTITPFLWFDTQAEDAMNLYLSIFKDGKSLNVTRVNGKVISVSFEMLGQKFIGLNAGPMHKFNEAVSFFVSCDTQAEVDDLWDKLSEGGSKGRCGWLKDKYGLSWQIIPKALGELMGDPDPIKSQAVMKAMMKMNKIVVDDLQKAHAGEAA
jgi:predicted 3-demethylubiquinone-9 3-methyltransferase (glyoxalase superfamily)